MKEYRLVIALPFLVEGDEIHHGKKFQYTAGEKRMQEEPGGKKTREIADVRERSGRKIRV